MEDHVTQNFLCPIDDVRVRRPTNSSEVSFNKYFQPIKIKVYHRKTFFNEYKLVEPLSSETTVFWCHCSLQCSLKLSFSLSNCIVRRTLLWCILLDVVITSGTCCLVSLSCIFVATFLSKASSYASLIIASLTTLQLLSSNTLFFFLKLSFTQCFVSTDHSVSTSSFIKYYSEQRSQADGSPPQEGCWSQAGLRL